MDGPQEVMAALKRLGILESWDPFDYRQMRQLLAHESYMRNAPRRFPESLETEIDRGMRIDFDGKAVEL